MSEAQSGSTAPSMGAGCYAKSAGPVEEGSWGTAARPRVFVPFARL